ncbi:MAG1430 family protein [Mycoplasma leonicaptivi]|uniref:MAG1430 family protein n=1 Tax=Mycoplasma leonicaptivi TaxID=36742 RepID=UPI0004814D7C|nr:hypothetical protein [Mycoplasma leonicaptivi]
MKNKNTWIKALTVIFFFIFGFGGTVLIWYIFAPKQKQKIQENNKTNPNEYQYNENLTVNNNKLSDFILRTNIQNQSNTLASSFAKDHNFWNSDVNATNDYWKNQLIKRNYQTQEQILENSFDLRTNNGVLLNVFNDNYKLEFNSYANDFEGKLFLEVIFTPKNIQKLKDKYKFIYTLEGFKTIKAEDVIDKVFFYDVKENEQEIKKYNNIDKLEQEYNKIKDKISERKVFLNKIFSKISSDRKSVLDMDTVTLSFNKTDKTIIINGKLQPKIVNASKNNLDDIKVWKELDNQNLYKSTKIKLSI